MCGRYVLHGPRRREVAGEIEDWFDVRDVPRLEPRYNIAPASDIPVVLRGASGERIVRPMRWGLVPAWAKDPAIGSKLVNARAETVDTKPAFRSAFRSRRCLVPAAGFYEWQAPATGRGRKQPWYVSPTDDPFFAFAGIMERWGECSDPLYTACIITTDANPLMAPIHDRMPVVIAREDWRAWLDPETPTDDLKALLRPPPVERMQAWPVSRAVNSSGAEGAALVERVEIDGETG